MTLVASAPDPLPPYHVYTLLAAAALIAGAFAISTIGPF